MSVDAPRDSLALQKDLAIDIPLYQDPGGAAARTYGLFDENLGINQPSVVIVAPSGQIIWQYIGENPRDRPVVERLLDALDAHRQNP